MSSDPLHLLIERWREDPNATYKSWFLWEERLKNFRSIRRGLQQVVTEMKAGTFGSLYKGSSLETVVKSIAEQRQIFKGADHAFLWKPKLRIPDIYESRDNQLAFAEFLDTCSCCNTEVQVLTAIRRFLRNPSREGQVCRRCAVRFEPIRAKARLFNTALKALPCGRFCGKSLKRMVSAEGIESAN